ncbi:glycosyltransferase WbuB [Stieleria sp. ICT_E10.1]|uniref:glycosyltransferase WbuB n=1 Tax=Stieleria sedimenti TaxID=2976331 RepID=UPI00217FA595|nr:glycosyltransferase WbuB [Stieleria sedimenti]MCS7465780.1 glycosyltransferase WbuB [Stieleria sedimenti]
MKILLHGLNYSPEEIGIGKYSGEMVQELAQGGHDVVVVTTPPYYPHWKIFDGFRGSVYSREVTESDAGRGRVEVIRCPLWVPQTITGISRVIHLASFGLSSIPALLWTAIRFQPDVVMTVEPAAFCMPTTWMAARVCGAKAWLHVQDFEIDAAFELGILKQPRLKRLVLAVEAFLMRRFDRVSSISPNMLMKLIHKGVAEERVVSFPNWVDCEVMRPIDASPELRAKFGIPADRCVALYAGNIGAKQGLEIVIDAARNCLDRSELHFVICGRGAAHEKLVDSARGLSNVQFLPLQPMECFNDLMNCADIHLLPQRADAADLVMPSKLTGMLATGRPIVACASKATQIADVVEGHGIVVPPADAAAFEDAMVRLAGDTLLREFMGAAARTYAVERLGRRSILAQFLSDLNELCATDVAPVRVSSTDSPTAGVRVDPVLIDAAEPIRPPKSDSDSSAGRVSDDSFAIGPHAIGPHATGR